MRILVSFIVAGLLLGGCGPTPHNPASESTRRVAEAERQLAVQERQRAELEVRLHQQEASAARWQSTAMFAAGVVILALVFGTILGTRARHETERK